ncbi:MAG: c-type cytochrome [Roseicyclus sp.]|uniref:c-type cytochrome n=1 Tax=Boseongicola sp. H5 TaxID=2763261 RepID=UPI001B094432|nr:c-type cytochrome [Boseongicola sp. H5]MBO6601678.1 c-type cytochrome [Roseicyclus sp.]MBO6624184.1 c-type cytochrome [Roseicyclus sp.]MBO6920846.1 c-type cytochrome [Roseicyclus sp.]
MNRTMILAAAATLLTAPMAFADSHAATPSGDAEAGEAAFRQCIACHVVVDAEGETLAGRNARTGPNLYRISGRTAGTVEDFRYSGSMVEAGEAGLVWDEETFVAYVQDPTGFLREFLDDSGARGSMSFRVRSEEDAADLYAYLASLAPAEE